MREGKKKRKAISLDPVGTNIIVNITVGKNQVVMRRCNYR